ncbi:hypothetical protein EOM09_05425 [bacterium]|nr:hypothetical protein [bacterium]
MKEKILNLDEIFEEKGINLGDFNFKNFREEVITDYALLKTNSRVLGVCETLFRFMDSIHNCPNYLEIMHNNIYSRDFTSLSAYSKKAGISLKNLLDEEIITRSGRVDIIQTVSEFYKKGPEYENTKVIGMHVPKIFQKVRSNEFYLVN